MSETRFIESDALLAVMRGDYTEARRLTRMLSRTELRFFEDAIDQLGEIAFQTRTRKSEDDA